MSLEIVGHRLLIKPDPVKEQVDVPEGLKVGGFEVVKPADLERREEAATQIGTVIQVGPTAFRAFDGNDPNWKPWCKPGDRVIFARYAGKFVEDPYNRLQTQKLVDWAKTQVNAEEPPITNEEFLHMNEEHQHHHH